MNEGESDFWCHLLKCKVKAICEGVSKVEIKQSLYVEMRKKMIEKWKWGHLCLKKWKWGQNCQTSWNEEKRDEDSSHLWIYCVIWLEPQQQRLVHRDYFRRDLGDGILYSGAITFFWYQDYGINNTYLVWWWKWLKEPYFRRIFRKTGQSRHIPRKPKKTELECEKSSKNKNFNPKEVTDNFGSKTKCNNCVDE